jgi:hypothetical protein
MRAARSSSACFELDVTNVADAVAIEAAAIARDTNTTDFFIDLFSFWVNLSYIDLWSTLVFIIHRLQEYYNRYPKKSPN